jgi:hypothetical protein
MIAECAFTRWTRTEPVWPHSRLTKVRKPSLALWVRPFYHDEGTAGTTTGSILCRGFDP